MGQAHSNNSAKRQSQWCEISQTTVWENQKIKMQIAKLQIKIQKAGIPAPSALLRTGFAGMTKHFNC